LDDVELGKDRIQEIVAALASDQGVDPKQILFRWNALKRMVLPEHGLQLDEKVYTLKIHLGKKTQAFTFAESAARNCVKAPEAFLAAYKDHIIAELKRLKRPESSARR